MTGGYWRASHLTNRPLHADEAVQAWLTWHLLRGDGYRYDPVDRHGPLLYFGAAGLHRLWGGNAANFGDRAARQFVWVAGVATLALIGLGATAAGFPRAVGAVAAALLAGETLTTLYQTYFVQEAWLALLVWAYFFLLLRTAPPSTAASRGIPFTLGILAGLAQCTKEIAPVYLFLATISVASVRRPCFWTSGLKAWGGGLVGWLIPYTLFYSSFGTNVAGLWDGLHSYAIQANRLTDVSHTYPWWHYARVLGVIGGHPWRWGEIGLLALAAGGLIGAIRGVMGPALRATAWFTLSLVVMHSVIPYKVPWLLVTAMIGLTLLAAGGLEHFGRRTRWTTALAIVAAILVIGQCFTVSQIALDRYPGDARNPYFYQQTSPGLSRLLARVEHLNAAADRALGIAVVSPAHAWPLPWYWRNHSHTGYFSSAPADLDGWDVVVWDSQLGEIPSVVAIDRRLEYHGLRPNVLLQVAVARPSGEIQP